MKLIEKIYLGVIPLAWMLVFTVSAIVTAGRWTINMTTYHEYEIEVGMNLLWFILFIKNLPEISKLLHRDSERMGIT